MLSRIAESLFWIGRYVERADGTSRILDASLSGMLEDPWTDEDSACRALLSVMGLAPRDGEDDVVGVVNSADVLEVLCYDDNNPSAVVGALGAARENARGAREVVSSELWESLNGTWNSLTAQRQIADLIGPAGFFSYVRDRTAALTGIIESTTSRDDGYRFIVLGRSLERVDMVSRLLSARVRSSRGVPTDAADWAVVLRACGADDTFVRTHRGATDASLVVQFLLLDRLFPRSVFHALATAETCLSELDPDGSRAGVADPAQRAVGRARTDLEYLDVDMLLTQLPMHLDRIQAACLGIGAAVAARYFQYADAFTWAHEEA